MFYLATFRLVTLLLLIPCAANAQVLYGSLTGNITDASTAPLPGAKVEARNSDTGVSRKAVTDERGFYSFNDLQPGTYNVIVAVTSFGTVNHAGIPIEANSIRRYDVKMQIAQVNETVTVEATAAVLQTDRADVNVQISSVEVENLPLDGGRNFQNLLKLVPGFTPPEELHSDAGNPQRSMGTNVNGVSRSNNNTRLDGATVSYPWLPHIIAYVPPADAIETVNIVTNSFDAEQGMAGGAAINVTIKSGTNQFHGTAHWYHTNSAVKARNYFYCLYTCPGDPNHPAKNILNQPGGTFGGPILKNKLFFFANWEMTSRRLNASGLKTLPTDALKRGDFTPYNTANIFDPASGNPDGTERSLFPGKIIPASRIDPAAAKMAAMLPTPTLTGVTNDYFASGSYLFNRYNSDFKVTYNPTSKTTLFTRYSFSPSNIFDPPSFGLAGGDALNGGQPGTASGLIQSASVGGTYTVNPRILLDGNIGFTRLRLQGESVDIGKNYGLDVLGIPGTNGTDRLQGGVPRFTVSGFSNFGNPNVSNPFLFRDNQFGGVLNLSWVKGAHSIRFGGEYAYYTINHFQPQTSYGPRGGFNFTGGLTILNAKGAAASNTYNGWADFLLGLPTAMGKDLQYVNPSAVRMPSYGFFIRDSWQVTRKLTINYGTRYEYYPFATRDHRGGERYDPATDKVFIGGVGNTPTDTGLNVGLGQLAPRFGLAYRLSDRTVIRSGFGISIDPSSFRYLRDAYPSVISLQLSGATSYMAAGSLRTGLPTVVGPDLSQPTIVLPTNIGDTTFPQDYKRGYIQSYNFTIQQDLGFGFVGQAGYVGTRAVRQTAIINLNSADAPGVGNAGRQLFPTYGRTADIKEMTPFNNATYNSLQARLTRRLRGGSFGVSFTYSKSLNYDDNSDSGLSWNGPSMFQRNRAVAGFNRPRNLQVFGVYQLPFGKGQKMLNHGFARKLAGGWQVNGTMSVIDGTPFTVGSSATSLNSPGNAQTADQVLEHVEILGSIGRGEKYFNPLAFKAVTDVRFGSSGRNLLRGPWTFNSDASLFRSFKVQERTTFQFRFEVFNVTNTPAFSNPAATVSSGGFAEITAAAATERRMRLALKILF